MTVGLLACFAVMIVVMMFNAKDATEAEWGRRVYLFMGMEAIVFTSVGWLFGREVNRTAVDSANAKADEATKAIIDKTEEAALERAKGESVKAYANASSTASAGEPDTGAQETGLDASNRDTRSATTLDRQRELKAFVNALWPDSNSQ